MAPALRVDNCGVPIEPGCTHASVWRGRWMTNALDTSGKNTRPALRAGRVFLPLGVARFLDLAAELPGALAVAVLDLFA